MRDEWIQVGEFPDYMVSAEGVILSSFTGRHLQPSLNQSGIVFVGLTKNGRQYKRSLALLVARHFIDVSVPIHFNTPIHLDGDLTNCRADNLAWRPRWFARKYHAQFPFPEVMYVNPIIDRKTNTVYENGWAAARELGLLSEEIFYSIFNNTHVFPFRHTFEEWIA